MPLPTLTCPGCNARFSLDVLFAHDGLNEVLKLVVNAHPEGKRLLGPMLRYAALFAPEKSEMSLDRLARVLGEIVPQMREAKLTHNGRIWAAPLDVWRTAFEEMLAKRDRLMLPLKSHGYLYQIIAGASNKGEAETEAALKARLASGARDSVRTEGPVHIDAALPKSVMPGHIREQLATLGHVRRRDQKKPDEDGDKS
jgi:hypothetical protein